MPVFDSDPSTSVGLLSAKFRLRSSVGAAAIRMERGCRVLTTRWLTALAASSRGKVRLPTMGEVKIAAGKFEMGVGRTFHRRRLSAFQFFFRAPQKIVAIDRHLPTPLI